MKYGKKSLLMKFVSFFLALILSMASILPAYADPVSEAVSETLEKITPYIILLPAEDGFEYAYPEDHLEKDLSTDEYAVLLYEAGENVSIDVKTELKFDIIDALDESVLYSFEGDSTVAFTMPESDLALVKHVEAPEENDAESEETPVETETLETEATEETVETENVEEQEPIVETEAVVETEVVNETANDTEIPSGNESEAVVEADESEAVVEADETETKEEAVLQSETVETEKTEEVAQEESETEKVEESEEAVEEFVEEESSEDKTVVDESVTDKAKVDEEGFEITDDAVEAIVDTKTELATEDSSTVISDDSMEDEMESALLSQWPDAGTVYDAGTKNVWIYDKNFDFKGFEPDHAYSGYDDVVTEYQNGNIDFSAIGDNVVTYKVFPIDYPSHVWYVEQHFEVVKGRLEANVSSPNADKILFNEQDASFKGIVPDMIGDTVEGGTYYADVDEDFDIWSLDLGYDLTVYNIGVKDDNGFTTEKEGSYDVLYEAGSYENPENQWFIHCQIKVGSVDAAPGTMDVRVKNGELGVTVTLADGSEKTASYGDILSSDSAIDKITAVSRRGNEIKPSVTVYKNGTTNVTKDVVKSTSLKNNIFVADLDETVVISDDSYTVVVDYPNYDPTADGAVKSTGGAYREEYFDNEVLQEKIQEEVSLDLQNSMASAEGEENAYVDLAQAAAATQVRSMGAIGSITSLGGPVTNYNYNGGGNAKAYNQAYVTFNADFLNGMTAFLDENKVRVTSAVPSGLWTSCVSGHGLWGWTGSGTCTGTTASLTLYDSNADGKLDRLHVSITAHALANHQTMGGSFTLATEEKYAQFRIVKKSDTSNFVAKFDSYQVKTTFEIFTNKKCTNDSLYMSVRLDEDDSISATDHMVAKTVELPEDTYWIKERSRCPGHAADTSVYGPYKLKAGEFTRVDQAILNKGFHFVGLLLKKISTENGVDGKEVPVEGAVYEFKTERDDKSYTWYFKTDAKGEISYDKAHLDSTRKSSELLVFNGSTTALPSCDLTIKEVEAPNGYVASDKVYTLKLRPTKDKNGQYSSPKITCDPIRDTNSPNFGYIDVQKYTDAANATNATIAARYDLSGAVYGIYNGAVADDRLYATITTDVNGYGISDKLERSAAGTTYYVKELQAPTCGAYKIDPNVYEVVLKTDQISTVPMRVNSTDLWRPATVSITKKLTGFAIDNPDVMNKLYASGKLANIRFILTHENGTVRDIITDNYGNGSNSELFCGTWTLVEDPATVPIGYKAIDPQVIEITPASLDQSAEHHVEIDEKPNYAFIEIKKLDLDSGNVVSMDSATFKIVDELGMDVTLDVKGVGKTTEFHTIGGEVKFNEPLKGGRYMLVELAAPEGYRLADPIPFELNKDGLADAPIVIASKDAPEKLPIEAKKIDRETKKLCGAGFKFNVIAAEDIKDGSGALRKLADGTEIKKDVVVTTMTTDETGIAKSEPLYLGKYYVQEVEVNGQGYAINPKRFEVVLEKGKNGQPVTIEIDNGPTNVKIFKIDTLTKAPLAGITFRVKPKDAKDADNQLFITNDKGEIRVPYLVKGTTYVAYETVTLPGYNLEDEVVEFKVDEKGLIDGKDTYEIHFTNKPNEVHISKKDITNDKELPGAHLVIKDAKGKVFDEWDSTDKEHIIYRMPSGKYTLTETIAPDQYELEKTIEFEVKNSKVIQTVTMKDSPYREVEISKKDITNNAELPGATLILKDADGNVIDEWVSTAEPRKFKLHSGKYVLTEKKPADGYVTSEEITFEVKKTTAEDYSVQHVTMTDDVTKVKLSKKDITTQAELPGATLQIKDEQGNVVDEWISTTEPHYVEKLKIGKYTLVETAPPEYYEEAKEVPFEITDSGKVHTVEMSDSPYREVVISKQLLTSTEELPGAMLEIRNEAGATVEKWVSGTTPHVVKLHSGKYTLVETKPADGYVTAESIAFEVAVTTAEDFAKLNLVMKDDVTKITISKKDITNGEELPGASLQIKNEKGDVVAEWISTTEPHYIEKLPIGKYTLVEKIAPDLYEKAEEIQFEILDTAEIQHVEMFDSPYREVEISKKSLTGSEEIEGARLEVRDANDKLVERWESDGEPHMMKLPSGTYTLIEKKPADGYVTAESIRFKVLVRDKLNDTKVLSVKMLDDVTKVQISKQDVTNNQELPGATLRITDSDGKLVEEWVSTTEPHYIEMLPIGTYTLTEITAPQGYDVAESVEFKVSDTDEIQHVVMYDSPTPVPGETTSAPTTGDDFNVWAMALIFCAAAMMGALGTHTVRKKK